MPALAESSTDMQAVLDELTALEAQHVHELDIPKARTQASPPVRQ